MSAIKKFFTGSVKFWVQGFNISLMNKLRIYKPQKIKTDGDKIFFEVGLEYAPLIKKQLRNFEFTAIENHNIFRGINFILNRFVLCAAILICGIIYFFLDGFIYSVYVQGGQPELTADIQTYLTSIGVKKYAFKSKIKNLNVAEEVVKSFNTVAHANMQIFGNTVVITIAEAENNRVNAAENIYSKYDAVIKEIWVSAGNPKVTVGDVVRVGDLLVENAYRDKVLIIGEVLFKSGQVFVTFDIKIM